MPQTTFLITGAAAGLGISTVTHLAALPNTLVFLTARNGSAGEAAAAKINVHPSSRVVAVQLDITSDESISTAHDIIAKELAGGPLDVLINNAGILCENPAEGPLRDRMTRAYATNTVGPATVSNAFLPLLKAAKHPRIVNISALAGSIFDASSPNTSHGAFWTYGPSKAALNYITAVLAVANPTIRVVSICPGLVSTALTSHAAKGAKPDDAAQFIVDVALQETGPSPAYFNKQGKIEW